jgi:branched-chain amino acid transport system substrate-binding protein
MRLLGHLLGAFFLLVSGSLASAQILIGQTIGLTGQVAATVKEANGGAALYIDAINAKGGVNGQKIELIIMDDKFDPKTAGANTRTLIEKRQVVAMFMSRGTPHTQEMIPILDQYNVPLIAPSTGAMLLHTPLKRNVFNVRPTYQAEAEKIINHLNSIGMNRIGVVHVDDTFGADVMEGIQRGFATAQISAAAIGKFDRSKPDFSTVVPAMVKADTNAVVIIGSGTAVVQGIKDMRAAGINSQFVTLSNNASDGFIKLLGDQAKGVIVSQVTPQTYAYPVVKEITELAKKNGIADISPAMLEGYLSAKVLVEGLRRIDGKPTRERLRASLESIQRFDLGGLELSFSPTDHTGLNFSDLSIITAAGKFRR